MKEIIRKLHEYEENEINITNSQHLGLSRVKSLDSIRRSRLGIEKTEKENHESIILNSPNIIKQPSTFLTGVEENKEIDISPGINSPKIEKSLAVNKSVKFDDKSSIVDKAEKLDKIQGNNIEISTSLLDALNISDEKVNLKFETETPKMPDICRNKEKGSFSIDKGFKTKPKKEMKTKRDSLRELKIPDDVHFSGIHSNSPLRGGFNSNEAYGSPRKPSFLKGNMSQVSLSLQYKLKELESSRTNFCPDLEMQNKRIHKTITNTKKRLLYLIKNCEDVSQIEKTETQICNSYMKKDSELLRRASKLLKEK